MLKKMEYLIKIGQVNSKFLEGKDSPEYIFLKFPLLTTVPGS